MGLLKLLSENYGYSYSSKCNYKFKYDCTSSDNLEELEMIIDIMEETTFDDFIDHVGVEELEEIGFIPNKYNTIDELKDDYSISYHKINHDYENEYDEWETIDAYIMEWSSIEFIFKKEE